MPCNTLCTPQRLTLYRSPLRFRKERNASQIAEARLQSYQLFLESKRTMKVCVCVCACVCAWPRTHL